MERRQLVLTFSSPRYLLTVAALIGATTACSSSGDDGSGTGGGGGSSGAELNGCKDSDYSDASDGGSINIEVAPGGALEYSPACLIIKAGQKVIFTGNLAFHPLEPGTSDDPKAGSPNNPIVATESGQSAEFTFPAAGDYPYYCGVHVSLGMAGVVRVVP